MPVADYLSQSRIAFEEGSTLVAVIDMSLSSWVVLGLVPGLERRPEKKLGADEAGLLSLVHRWRDEAERRGCRIERICVAFESGRDGFWLARWLEGHGIEAHVIHASSIPVKREQRRAKTDRLDCRLLMRAFVGWLRGEAEHCRMVAVPSIEAEDAKTPHRERAARSRECTRVINRMKSTLARLGVRGFKPELKKAAGRLDDLRLPTGEALPPNARAELRRDMALLRVLRDQIEEIKDARDARLAEAPEETPHAMVRMLAGIRGLGVETADMLVSEALSRDLPDRRAVARYGGLTGSPDESGARRRERGLARAGNARVRHGMIQLAWRFLWYQPDCALVQWYRERTGADRNARKKLIVALARKLLIALWRFVTQGLVPEGVVFHPAR